MTEQAYWIPGPWLGKVAIIPRPRGSEWLVDEIQSWKANNLDVAVSLLTPSETHELELDTEQVLAEQLGIRFFSFPIQDRDVLSSFAVVHQLLEQLTQLASAGKNIGIHCRQGIGRSSLIAASMLVIAGVAVDEAFAQVEVARGCSVPDTDEQSQWVKRFAVWATMAAA
jgi:protein-tyrosine phosphatase